MTSHGLPSEAELLSLASSLMPAYNTADAQSCAGGIADLAATGNTSVADRAFARGQAESERVVQAAQGSFGGTPGIGGTAYGFPDEAFGTLSYSEYDRIAQEAMAQSADWGQAVSLGGAVPAEWAGAPVAASGGEAQGLGARQNAAPLSYSPTVMSQSQADVAQQAGTGGGQSSAQGNSAQDSANGRSQADNARIVIGTKTLEQIRADFPILQEKVHGHDLVWLDNGATTQRPRQVIDRLTYYYEHENSNVHRGVHELADRSTNAYEGARQTVADFIGAPSKDDIVFVRGTTEAINLVAQAYVKPLLAPGDEIIVSLLEHHANIVPWQLVAQETGAVIKVIPIDDKGQLLLGQYERLFTPRTKFVSVTHVSNTLGTITPVDELVATAHRHGVRILVDGAQSIAHIPVNVSAMDADFYVFSGHKVYAPTGIGVVYGKSDALAQARPYQGGGNMIKDVTFERTIYNEAPNKFEAGTGSIADAVGLGAALDYLSAIGMPEVARYEHELTQYAMAELQKVPGLHLYGHALERSGVLSFTLDGHSIEEVGTRLNEQGIAVRAGHHCAQPVLRSLGLEGTVRPVLALYNSPADVDLLVRGIRSI